MCANLLFNRTVGTPHVYGNVPLPQVLGSRPQHLSLRVRPKWPLELPMLPQQGGPAGAQSSALFDVLHKSPLYGTDYRLILARLLGHQFRGWGVGGALARGVGPVLTVY